MNTYQVVLASDGQESYALFLYPERAINWIKGDGKTQGLPDAQAQSGFMSGDGRLYILPGSGSEHLRNLDRTSNTNPREPGVWLFRVGRTGSTGNVVPALEQSPTTPEQETCSYSENPCPPTSVCTDYNPGFCCACQPGTIGNGRSCLPASKRNQFFND